MKKLNKNEKILAIGIGCLLLVFLLFKIFSRQQKPPQPSGTPFSGGLTFNQPLITESSSSGEEPGRKFNFLLDPFKKPDIIATNKGMEADKPFLRLEGIFWSEDKPLVVINGEVLKVNEVVEGFKVSKITKDSVELIKDRQVYILKLEGANILNERR